MRRRSNFASSGRLSRNGRTLGASALRSVVVTQSAVSLPSWSAAATVEVVEQDLDIACECRLQRRTAPPDGTCTIFKPVNCRNQRR